MSTSLEIDRTLVPNEREVVLTRQVYVATVIMTACMLRTVAGLINTERESCAHG